MAVNIPDLQEKLKEAPEHGPKECKPARQRPPEQGQLTHRKPGEASARPPEPAGAVGGVVCRCHGPFVLGNDAQKGEIGQSKEVDQEGAGGQEGKSKEAIGRQLEIHLFVAPQPEAQAASTNQRPHQGQVQGSHGLGAQRAAAIEELHPVCGGLHLQGPEVDGNAHHTQEEEPPPRPFQLERWNASAIPSRVVHRERITKYDFPGRGTAWTETVHANRWFATSSTTVQARHTDPQPMPMGPSAQEAEDIWLQYSSNSLIRTTCATAHLLHSFWFNQSKGIPSELWLKIRTV